MIDFIKSYFTCTWPERVVWTILLVFFGLILLGSFNTVSHIYDCLQFDYTCTDQTVIAYGKSFTIASVNAPGKVESYIMDCEDALAQYSWYHIPICHMDGVVGILSKIALSISLAVLLGMLAFITMSYVNIIHCAINPKVWASGARCTNPLWKRFWLNFVGDIQFIVIGHSSIASDDIGIERVWTRF